MTRPRRAIRGRRSPCPGPALPPAPVRHCLSSARSRGAVTNTKTPRPISGEFAAASGGRLARPLLQRHAQVNTPPLPLAEDPADFSLVLGGPLFQLLRRSHLSDDALTLVHRRILAGVLITWLPLLLLSVWEGRAWWGNVAVPFLLNAEVHARFLIALPLLVLAELVVHVRMRRTLVQLSRARPDCRRRPCPASTRAIESAMRLRNSLAAELLLVVAIYGLGFQFRDYIAVDASTWAAGPAAGSGSGFANLSLAGWWNALVSVPALPVPAPRAGISACSSGPAFSGRCRASTSSSSRRIPTASEGWDSSPMSSTRSLRCSSRTGFCSRA